MQLEKRVGHPQLDCSVNEVKRMNALRAEINSLELEFEDDSLGRRKKAQIRRKLGLQRSRLERLEKGDYGRRIPKEISEAVIERDKRRDFGRPDHICAGVRSLHHVKKFEDFLGDHTRENPHTINNLEAPCRDCHELAHAMNIPSGISIETFFKGIPHDEWITIEDLWKEKQISVLRKKDYSRFI